MAVIGHAASARGMKGVLRTIEQWASESDDRVKLIVVLVWAAFGVFVLLSTLIAAWIMLPAEFRPF
jgi:hypothetical protein